MPTIGLVQINNGFQYYLPYSIGLLQAYAQAHARCREDMRFGPLVHARGPLADQAAALAGADIVGFSAYLWNMQYSLALAQELKQRQPETLIVFGGPQVPGQAEAFLREHPFIDICVHGEGEAVFTAILDAWSEQDWSGVPGISYLDSTGTFTHHPVPPRLKDLERIPSPYLTGILDHVMAASPGTRWLAAWETNRGCPFSCTFCDWGQATRSKVHAFDLERICREIDWLARHRIEFVVCCDANFGILPRDIDIARYLAEVKRATGYPGEVVVQNTKNATDRSFLVHQILYEARAIARVTLSLQSLADQALKSVRRQNISLDTFRQLQQRFNAAGIETYTDVIVGLPGETYASFADGVAEIIANGQHDIIWFYNLYILPNAEVADPAYQREHGLETICTAGIYRNTPVTEALPGPREIHEIVIATRTMPRPEWVRSRVFAWMAALLHFGVKPLQAAFISLNQRYGLSYRELIEAFTEELPPQFILLAYIRQFLRQKAMELQAGGPEFCQRADQTGLLRWMSPEDDILLELYLSRRFDAFFQEAAARLRLLLRHKGLSDAPDLLGPALAEGRERVMAMGQR